jgi:formylglycine-generating enzyme required for sulfatase activity
MNAINTHYQEHMILERPLQMFALVLAIGAGFLTGAAEEKSVEAKVYPLWDGKEAVAEYAKRVALEPEMSLDLGDGVKMDFVLIPAGKFLMGTPQPESLWIGGGILIGGGTLAFALLAAMVIGMVRRRSFWPQFSLLGLLAFMSAMSVVAHGGVRWREAEQAWANRSPNEMPAHEVTLAQPFYMGKFEVTQKQYEKIIKSNPSEFKGARNPVERVSWIDAQAFCKQMSQKTGRPVRLPSEAEWEYACRAGTRSWFYNGDKDEDLDRVGWYYKNSGNRTHPVGEKKPNAFGLYDMHGNVWEWCEDHWHNNYKGAPADGSAWVDKDPGGGWVVRGGSWDEDPWRCRSAYRRWLAPGDWISDNFGFRVVVAASSPRTSWFYPLHFCPFALLPLGCLEVGMFSTAKFWERRARLTVGGRGDFIPSESEGCRAFRLKCGRGLSPAGSSCFRLAGDNPDVAGRRNRGCPAPP